MPHQLEVIEERGPHSRNISQSYTWDSMEEKIKQKTAECEQCMRGNPSNRKDYGMLQELEKKPRKASSLCLSPEADIYNSWLSSLSIDQNPY